MTLFVLTHACILIDLIHMLINHGSCPKFDLTLAVKVMLLTFELRSNSFNNISK